MCKCCDEINFWKRNTPDTNKFKEKIFAKISVYTWLKEDRAIRGKQVCDITSRTYNLNYCPTCRSKVRRKNKMWGEIIELIPLD